MVRCGCFWGALCEFEKKVIECHSGSRYKDEYLAEIKKVRKLLEED